MESTSQNITHKCYIDILLHMFLSYFVDDLKNEHFPRWLLAYDSLKKFLDPSDLDSKHCQATVMKF